ncbi:selenium metabolism-associated LysR family transcriptional regulator [Candidatus Oleimmundimicrobium sp.]|uniref:selenium metabolism-associated LysR family transcriptional regulator n=1 Tax=Candidatus Oleimmundimicrobium sp. TaxID=3060597 RepID=UPI002715BB7B|nr:selenium metabolism-associated LysR family transcriptional regulator [Candidatus Oleimmundimicrobium sp.]MDO8886452.1 selenium metabolism-associated LysR family transcriptional regulator [Candidatus Oleimmundimicrobium sp.]
MNLNYFETFIIVIEKGSFSKTAKAMDVSQPAISFQIQAMEKEYGQTLLDRSGNKTRPTEAGKIFYRFAKEMVRNNELLKESLDEFKNVVRGKLVLGASTTPGEYIVPKILGQFKKKFPDVEPELYIADTDDIVEKLINHEIDIAFVGRKILKDDIEHKKFTSDELILIVHPSHQLAKKNAVTLEEVISYPLILREEGSATRKTFENLLKNQDILEKNLNVTMELGSIQAILSAVEADLGISIISKYAAEKELALGLIKTVPFKKIHLTRDIHLIYNKNRSMTKAQKEFIDFALIKQR